MLFRKWYSFCTTMLAMLGGTFVTMKLASQVTLVTVALFGKQFLKQASGFAGGGLTVN